MDLSGYSVNKIDHHTAKEWVETWHYSKRYPTGKNIPYGVYNDQELYAVIVYGIGVNPYQAQFLGVDRVLEIKRMCRREPAQDYPLSKLIGVSSKLVFQEFPYDCLVAFADPEYGHEGGVYKASSFELHGKTNAEWHLEDENGDKRHRRYAFRYSRRKDIPLAQAREELGLKRIKTAPKYRWVRYRSLRVKRLAVKRKA